MSNVGLLSPGSGSSCFTALPSAIVSQEHEGQQILVNRTIACREPTSFRDPSQESFPTSSIEVQESDVAPLIALSAAIILPQRSLFDSLKHQSVELPAHFSRTQPAPAVILATLTIPSQSRGSIAHRSFLT